MTPPAPLLGTWATSRTIDAWPPGGAFYHCHSRRCRPSEFNPAGGPRNRFSPIDVRDGTIVPTWYAASTPLGAVAESILHDIPVDAAGIVTRGQYQGRQVSAVHPTRPLRVVRLDTDGLRSLRRGPDEVTETEASDDARTVTIAQHLYDTTDVDGLAWVSSRRNIDCAVMLFGDRVAEGDLAVGTAAYDFDSLDGWEWLAGVVAALGIEIQPPV